jgi:ribonuclease G
MNKELFVTATPHETKVGLVEDDQLAEIYLEREGEYTLAGSIYKGRVTRVLPGMQSAFVDVGLERDAFLYVSDFFELEDQGDGDAEVIPVRPVTAQGASGEAEAAEVEEIDGGDTQGSETGPVASGEAGPAPEARVNGNNGGRDRDRDRGGWRGRGRRRRGGRREFGEGRSEGRSEGRGELRSESRESRPPRQEALRTEARQDYGPPPGYQPMILPGESISKYRGAARSAPVAPASAVPQEHEAEAREAQERAIAAAFPADEPTFAVPVRAEQEPEPERREPAHYEPAHRELVHQEPEVVEEEAPEPMVAIPAIPAIPARVQEEEHAELTEEEETQEIAAPLAAEAVHAAEPATSRAEPLASRPKPSRSEPPASRAEPLSFYAGDETRVIEEEEILEEEDEAELAAYAEDSSDEVPFEDLELETHEPGGVVTAEGGVAANGEEAPMDAAALAEEFQMSQQQEAELEAIQEEAEKLADAVERGEPVEARAEVRAPAATAAFLQRAQRQPSFDRRRGGRRGQQGGGQRRFRRREAAPTPQITELLKEGQEVLIQIAKEPIGKKGARITSHIALPGRFLVYMPTVNHTGVSRKISSDEERQRLKRIVSSERENGQGGFIVRTAAAGAAEDELRADIRFLKSLWHEINQRANDSKAPALIYHDLNVVERVLRDQVTSDFTQVWVDSEVEYERILRFAQRFQPALIKRIKLYTKEQPLFEQFGLQEEMNKALKSKVWLKSGGYIVINQTEALVAIDVNTGKYVGKTARLEDTIVKTNVDAIKEIVRQIRLRDLGGIIVIDFIDMDERRNRQKVMAALDDELRNDRAPSKVLAFNDFGLVAITRKRVKQSLERTIGAPCPYCTATGYVKSPTTVCNEIYVEMRKMSKHLNHSDVMLRVNPEVAKALKGQNGRWLQEMEEMTKHTIIVKSDASLHQEQFDIN